MKINSFNKRRFLITSVLLLICIVIYLNRAYAHIYNTIGRAALESSDHQSTYFIKNSISTNTKPVVYVALGDSLTAGVGLKDYHKSYPYLLAQDFSKAGFNIILKDRAIPGERSSGLLKNLLPLALKDNPDIVTIFIGINDIHGNISLANFEKNYNKILKELKTKTKAKIYLINLPDLGSKHLLLFPYNYLLDLQTRRFNFSIKRLALKYKVNYIDLYQPTKSVFNKSINLYSSDSFHPSAQGYYLWSQIIYDRINK